MLRRPLALALIAPALPALAVGAAVVPAAADDVARDTPTPVLRWEVSQFFDDHLAVHELSDGATEDAGGVITFPAGVGTYDRATGAGSIAYQGQVAGSFAFSGATQYTITVADPVVTVDETGEGTISVVLSSEIPAGSTQAQDSTPPTRLVAATFEADRWVSGEGDLGTQTVTPRFAGVLPAGSAEATELGIPAGQPIDGASFAPSFLRNLVPGVRAIFYKSGSSSDAKKAPATLVAQGIGTGVATEPEPDAADALQWEVSSAFDATMETHTLAGGATEDEVGVVTFPRASGTYDSVTGESTVTYAGSVTAKDTEPLLPNPGLPFPLPGSDQTYDVATVTIADPVVTTDLDGNAVVTAVVSSSNPLGPGGIPASTDPTRVEVVRFAAGVDPWIDGTERGKIVRTPSVFSQAFVDQVVAPAQDNFATVATAAPESLPSQLTAAAPPAPLLTPATTVTTTGATPEAGLTLKVDGTGFRGVTRSGDTGVKVGLARRGALPDVTTEAGLAEFAAIATVPTAQITDHAFTTTLASPAASLDPDELYSVYTWQAPSRSNPTQDTVVPVTIDFVALGLAEALVPTVVVTQVAADADTITWSVAGTGFTAVTNPGDAGVYVGLAESGGLPDVTVFDTSKFVTAAWVMPAQIVDHAFTAQLTADRSELDPTKEYSFYTWQAHTYSNTSQDTETQVAIGKRQVALGTTSAHFTTYGKRATFVVTLPDDATGSIAVTGLGARRTSTVVDGAAAFSVPAGLAAKRYRPTFAYTGDATYDARSVATFYTVRKALPTLRVTRPAAGRVVVRVVGPAGAAKPTGLVDVDGRTGRLSNGRAVVSAKPSDRVFVVRYAGAGSYRAVRGTFRNVRPAR